MISETVIRDLVEEKINNTPLFLVDVKVRAGNKIIVYVDGDTGFTIDECANLSRYIESKLDRDTEDYELEVSSPGVTQPLKVERQYKKNIGKQLQILLRDGIKRTGTLLNSDKHRIQIEEKIKIKGKTETTTFRIPLIDIKETKVLLTIRK